MMKMIADKVVWGASWMDTPMSTPNAKTRLEAEKIPGCRVKSNERARDGMPLHFGILVKYDEDKNEVTVRSNADGPDKGKYPESDGCVVWRGTTGDYHRMWGCD